MVHSFPCPRLAAFASCHCDNELYCGVEDGFVGFVCANKERKKKRLRNSISKLVQL